MPHPPFAAIDWEWIWGTIRDEGIDFGLNLLGAIAIFFVGRWAAGILIRILEKVMERAKIDDTLAKFLGNIGYALMMTFVVVGAIDQLGVDTTSLAAILAAAGLAVGLALQGSLSNFAAGVMLILFQPFKVGDYIDAGGTGGTVEEIHIFNTLMRTGDNVQIVVPNGQITSGRISNFSAKPTRRIDLVVGCGYDDDIKAVKEFLVGLVNSDDRILKDPQPLVAVHELADNCVNFVARPWVNNSDYWAVRWDLTEKIKTGFDERGFSIPFPQRDVHVHGMTVSA